MEVGHVAGDALGILAAVDAIVDRCVGNAMLCPARVPRVGRRVHVAALVVHMAS